MWLNLSKRGFKFKKIPDIIGCFYQREDSVSMDNLKIAQEEDREIQQLHKWKLLVLVCGAKNPCIPLGR